MLYFKKIILIISLFLISFGILQFKYILPIKAQTPPEIPYTVWGTVKIDNTSALDGTNITAFINGTQFGQTDTISGFYSLNIPGDDPTTPQKDGGVFGDVVTFNINGIASGESGVWQSGVTDRIDLDVEIFIPTPTPTSIPTSNPTPIQTPLPTATPTPIPTLIPTPNPTPTLTPISTPTQTPISTPVPTSTVHPISTPTPTSTIIPTVNPTPAPSYMPSPTAKPSNLPQRYWNTITKFNNIIKKLIDSLSRWNYFRLH